SSFIKANRSVPPARIWASFQSSPNNLTACSLVVGLAYSNPCIVASLLSQRLEHPIRGQRQVRHSYTYGVCYGIRDRGTRRIYRSLSQPNSSALTIAFAPHHMDHELADIADSRKFVKLHIRVEHPTRRLIHYLLFIKGIGNSHYERAIALA